MKSLLMAVTLLAVTTVLIAAIGSVLLKRWVRRRHRVNPHLPTLAPLSWLWSPFLARYRERLLPRLEDARPHFFTFKRVLLWGRH